MTLAFSELGLTGAVSAEELWTETRESAANGISAALPPHGAKLYLLRN